MAFEVFLTDEACADLDFCSAYIRSRGSIESARKWFAEIHSVIESLSEMPERCPVVAEAAELGLEVRVLLHGRKNRSYKIYYAINNEVPPTGTVRVFHIRHWARKPITEYELEELMDDPDLAQ
jgi:plasmid stabilization system protein ParE